MVARQTQVVRIPVIDERERAGRQRVPGERRNRIEGRLQLCPERLIHIVCPFSIVQHLTIDQMLAPWPKGNLFKFKMLRADQQLPL